VSARRRRAPLPNRCWNTVANRAPPATSEAAISSSAARLSAGVSRHYPCGDPIWLKARVRNAAGHGVKGVKVTFSFKLKSGAVRRQATTDSRGVARVKITPVPDTAPQVVRVDGKVKAVYRGVTLTAAT